MKKLLLTSLLASTFVYAQTTMCFKENHSSMSTIESTKLDGGECKSIYSIQEMKKNGWNIDDIKITPNQNSTYSFIYILKKNSANTQIPTAYMTKEEMKKSLKEFAKEEKKQKEIEKKISQANEGKETYIKKCQSCHGKKGEVNAYGVSKPLKDLSFDDIEYAIDQYTRDNNYGYGYNIVMRPIASSITSNQLKNIKSYLNSLNK